ncbi:long-chain-fatty-acyl-CoA reductase [Novosphingobium sp. G106]|uniref:acyl-CoA reductase n=1 Tax=Novosphingobium sp. G106 TaxID=2849500 RepID=UPI001C2D5523|nr:acyl-CoA reductase [Novosphingobium sp. G106]MBV1688906.1 long-chain-fatty-acyl-CoA reductase [Novosphingobium sp. G106]
MNADVAIGPRGAVETARVIHVVKGRVVDGAETAFGSGAAAFTAPRLDIDELVWSRREPGPAFDIPTTEILDLLVATGEEMRRDTRGFMAEALDNMARTCSLERRIVENCYQDIIPVFTDRAALQFMIDQEVGGTDVLDGWRQVERPNGQRLRLRAYPPRLMHVLAGNVPSVAAGTIAQMALTKGVHLLKMPSNDLYTAPAILRTMDTVAPGHPVVRSFSAVYWRGGDATVEGAICRPQFFDKVVAWGGEAAIRGIKTYTGPGLELVSFDPKTSISLIGRDAFSSPATLAEAAELAAIDATHYNQEGCICSRFQFVEGTLDEVDRFCSVLQQNLMRERRTTSALCSKLGGDIREEIAVLREMEPDYRVWGTNDGAGLVIRSQEPVEFHPEGKIVNVVPVATLDEAARFATVATATVGVHPFSRKSALRDGLASAGVQRIVDLGQAMAAGFGTPHDGFWAFNRCMRWITEEDAPEQAEGVL